MICAGLGGSALSLLGQRVWLGSVAPSVGRDAEDAGHRPVLPASRVEAHELLVELDVGALDKALLERPKPVVPGSADGW